MTSSDSPALSHDLSIVVPSQWVSHRAPERGIALAARSRSVPPSGFPPRLVLETMRAASPQTDPAPSDAEPLEPLHTRLTDLEVEDIDTVDLDGHPVTYLRFSHRVGDTDVLCDQWQWRVEGAAVTLTGSVAREDYADYCDLFEEVAASVELSPVRRAA